MCMSRMFLPFLQPNNFIPPTHVSHLSAAQLGRYMYQREVEGAHCWFRYGLSTEFFWFTLSYSAMISVWLIMFCLKFCCYVEAPSIFLKSTSKKFQNTIEACSVGNKVKASFLGFSLWIILLSMLFSRHQIAHLAFACRYEVSIFLFTWRSHTRVLPCG
jgi:hypothetical protein